MKTSPDRLFSGCRFAGRIGQLRHFQTCYTKQKVAGNQEKREGDAPMKISGPVVGRSGWDSGI
jgi:hypothetical protein